jgi:hypothetical protein
VAGRPHRGPDHFRRLRLGRRRHRLSGRATDR